MDPLLSRLSDVVPRAESLEQLTRPLLEMLGSITGLESTYLTSIDLEAGLQHVQYARNVDRMQIPEGLSVPWQDTLCKRSLDEGRWCTDDVAGVWGDSDAARALGIRTYISTPVRTQDGRLLGTLCAASARQSAPGPAVQPMLQLFSRLIGTFVERDLLVEQLRSANAELASQALTDPLTALPNRRAILDQLPRLMAQARRDGRCVLVGMIDLDHFKAINDTHGHRAGDEFLCEVGRRIGGALRATDVLGRIGGDEFVVLAPGPQGDDDTAESAVDEAARVLQRRVTDATAGAYALASARFDYAGASVGVVPIDPDDTGSDAALQRADAAMYRVKLARRPAAGQASA